MLNCNNKDSKDSAFLGDLYVPGTMLTFWYLILFSPHMTGNGNRNSHCKDTVTETKLS